MQYIDIDIIMQYIIYKDGRSEFIIYIYLFISYSKYTYYYYK